MAEVQSKINIRPGVSVLSVLQHLNYRPWFAMAEFVDNALQSFLDTRDILMEVEGPEFGLKVDIQVDTSDTGRITVRDNAGGIRTDDYERAFRPAELPPEREGLSEFGMGMKSAACWFAPRWRVRTSAIGEDKERLVKFDIDSIVEDNIEELDVEVRQVPGAHHYTEIVLQDLHRIPHGRTIGKIKEHLASIYRVFIRNELLELTYNGERLNYEPPPILVAPFYKTPDREEKFWKKDITFDFGLGLSVRGFAAIREKGSTSKAGFALFRRNRLIEGSLDDAYRPEEIFGKSNSFIYQRLFGELHLEGFDVSHTKDGFRWGENEEVFLDLLKDHLNGEPTPLLDQAQGYRARHSTKEIQKGVDEAISDTADDIREKAAPILDKLDDAPDETEPEREFSIREEITKKLFTLRLQEVDWQVVLEAVNDPAVGDWIELVDAKTIIEEEDDEWAGANGRGVGIRVSLSHPFMVRFGGTTKSELEPLVRLAAALGLAEIVARDSGVELASTIRRNVNQLLRGVLSGP